MGDLLMAGVLTLQIAIDDGRFQLADAMQSIVTKLIRRHPHVFGDVSVDGVDAIWANWDAIKAQEKAAKGQVVEHPLDGVPTALPALEKARALQSKAQKAGLLDRAAVAATLEETAVRFMHAHRQSSLTEAQVGELLWCWWPPSTKPRSTLRMRCAATACTFGQWLNPRWPSSQIGRQGIVEQWDSNP
ncbi:MAG: MazG nucleotide pyrophosphohydrolase domain-containing protein [Caldilineaceae bacterium]